MNIDLADIRRRLPDVPRDQMSLAERDRVDLFGAAEALERVRALVDETLDRHVHAVAVSRVRAAIEGTP